MGAMGMMMAKPEVAPAVGAAFDVVGEAIEIVQFAQRTRPSARARQRRLGDAAHESPRPRDELRPSATARQFHIEERVDAILGALDSVVARCAHRLTANAAGYTP